MQPMASDSKTNYVGFYYRWGHEPVGCYGGVGTWLHPDVMELWIVDDQGNEHYGGHGAHHSSWGPQEYGYGPPNYHSCEYHQGTFADNIHYQGCQADQDCANNVLQPYLLNHVHNRGVCPGAGN